MSVLESLGSDGHNAAQEDVHRVMKVTECPRYGRSGIIL
jgi:hypothetical protein